MFQTLSLWYVMHVIYQLYRLIDVIENNNQNKECCGVSLWIVEKIIIECVSRGRDEKERFMEKRTGMTLVVYVNGECVNTIKLIPSLPDDFEINRGFKS